MDEKIPEVNLMETKNNDQIRAIVGDRDARVWTDERIAPFVAEAEKRVPLLAASLIGLSVGNVEMSDAVLRWPASPEEPFKQINVRRCNLGYKWLPDNFKVLESFDAQHWAASFLATLRENPDIVIDHDLMVTWFANALMRGHDEHRWSTPEYKAGIRRVLHPWWSWKRYFPQEKKECRGNSPLPDTSKI